ncbi:MAG: hypothetical protein IRZ00_02735 [Gemmatimonadetes bacterium]|nr:hypothetical protein [Gemmatimonadota bacterium]
MTVPIQISWDLYLGKVVVWCECLLAGVRRAVLLPRLDTIFSPVEEDPGREQPYDRLDWRLVSPTEADWQRYREMVEKQALRHGVLTRVQRVESIARWMGGRQVAVPQYHIWLYREPYVGETVERLYEEPNAEERRALWRWLLAWTAPAAITKPYNDTR